MSHPVRTCTGCRERAAKNELIRVVAAGTSVTVDPTQTQPGRGAYLHRREDCLLSATKRRTIGRALRVELDAQRAADVIRPHLGVLA